MPQEKLYPDSGVELTPFIAKNYDLLMNLISFGGYNAFIKKAIGLLDIKPHWHILDLGCGTGKNAKLMLQYLNNGGRIIGLDISDDMKKQFDRRFRNEPRVSFIKQRIDIPFDLNLKFDMAFISFVIHGFPHEVRKTIIQNVVRHLKPGGVFAILDFAEFDMDKMPKLHRKIFTTIECKYAFDFIARDWKSILSQYGFGDFQEHFFIKNYVRLLKGTLKHE